MVNKLYPFASHFLNRQGLRYHYVDEGPSSSTSNDPVLMVHGNPTWSFYYRELIKTLRPNYRCIAPDHMGCGLSDKPTDKQYDYTLARRVEDLTGLVEALELPRVTLVVHDWGGMIGMAWAVANPQRVGRIVVMNTAAFHMPQNKTFPRSLSLARMPGLSSLLVRGLGAFSRSANRLCVTRPMSPEVAKNYLAPYDSWANRIAIHRFVQDIPLFPTDRAYSVVTQTQNSLGRLRDKPMLLLWGMKDFVFDRSFLDAWQEHFPAAQVHRFDNAGHYLLEDSTREVTSLVKTFVGQPAASVSTASPS